MKKMNGNVIKMTLMFCIIYIIYTFPPLRPLRTYEFIRTNTLFAGGGQYNYKKSNRCNRDIPNKDEL